MDRDLARVLIIIVVLVAVVLLAHSPIGNWR